MMLHRYQRTGQGTQTCQVEESKDLGVLEFGQNENYTDPPPSPKRGEVTCSRELEAQAPNSQASILLTHPHHLSRMVSRNQTGWALAFLADQDAIFFEG